MPSTTYPDLIRADEADSFFDAAPDVIPADQADSFFGDSMAAPAEEKPFRFDVVPSAADRKNKLAKLQADAAAAQEESRKANSPLGMLKNFGVALRDNVTSAGKVGATLGQSLAAPYVAQKLTESKASAEDVKVNLLKTIREKEARGEDTTRLKQAYNNIADNTIDVKAKLHEIVPALDKTTLQAIGELGGVALDILTAGTYGKVASGAASSVGKGAVTAAKTGSVPFLAKGAGLFTKEGAVDVAKGALIGYGYDVTGGLQGNRGEERMGGNALIPGTGTALGAGIPAAIRGVQTGVNISTSVADNLSTDRFITKRAGAFEEFFNSGVKTKKLYESSKGKGYDVARTLASDDRYVPTGKNGGIVDGKIVPDAQITAIQEDAKPLAQIIRGAIEVDDKSVPLQTMHDQAIREINNLRLRGDEYNRVKANIDKDFAFYGEHYADPQGNIPLTIVDDIKKAKYGEINWMNTDQYSADRAVSKAARKTVETSLPDTKISQLNKELGKLYDAQEMLEAMGGRAVKGGRMGKYFARGLGVIVGSTHGPAGSIFGAITADRLADIMQSSYFESPILQSIIGEIKSTRPGVFDEAEKLIAQKAADKASRLRLPAPSFIPMGGPKPNATDSTRVFSDYDEFLAAQGLDRKAGQLALPPGNGQPPSTPIQIPPRLQSSVDAAEAASRASGAIPSPSSRMVTVPAEDHLPLRNGQTTSSQTQTAAKQMIPPATPIRQSVPSEKALTATPVEKMTPTQKSAFVKKTIADHVTEAREVMDNLSKDEIDKLGGMKALIERVKINVADGLEAEGLAAEAAKIRAVAISSIKTLDALVTALSKGKTPFTPKAK